MLWKQKGISVRGAESLRREGGGGGGGGGGHLPLLP